MRRFLVILSAALAVLLWGGQALAGTATFAGSWPGAWSRRSKLGRRLDDRRPPAGP
jgi:hypothetical protein